MEAPQTRRRCRTRSSWSPPWAAVGKLVCNPAALRPLLGPAAAIAVVAGLASSPLWVALRGGLLFLDFDPDRASLIAAWAACLALAALAGALTGRPWPATLVATAFLAVTHVAPWAWSAVVAPPVLLGSAEQLSPPALLGEAAAMLAVGFLVAIPGAAGGSMIGAAAAALRRRWSWGRLTAMVAVSLAALVVVMEAGPLLRYGPAHGLYLPAGTGLVPTGRVLVRTFHSEAMAADRPFAVYLPPAYGQQGARRYPVVFLLHGEPGGYRDWLNLGLAPILDSAIANGSLPPLIAVMPEGNGEVTKAAQWANAWDGRDRVEDSVLELVRLVDRQYRTLADRRHRVVGGFSEGGFGAANLAARHPGLFGTAISLSGYFTAEGPVFGVNPAYQHANSPSQLLRSPGPARGVAYLLAAGDQDGRYRRASEQFAAELDRLGVRHELFLLSGGHEGGVWTSGLVLCLQEVKNQLQARP